MSFYQQIHPRSLMDARPYQPAGVQFIKEKKRCALFVDPGLGKTVITATAFNDLIEDFLCGPVLVVAPPRVADKTWSDEFKAWAHLNNKSYVIIKGSPEKRRKLLQRRACFHVISMENVHWLLRELGGDYPRYEKEKDGTPRKVSGWRSPKKIPYYAIVVDESSKVKDPGTRRFNALRMMAFKSEYFVILTGTPTSNGLDGLWSQVYLLDQGRRLGASRKEFRDRWFNPPWDGQGNYRLKGDWAKKAIEEAISDIVFTLREEDYGNLPPRMYNNIMIDLEKPVMDKYKEFERKYVLETLGGEKITAINGAVLAGKLMQLANGIVYKNHSDGDRSEHEFHHTKLDALRDLAEEMAGEPLFVVYNSIADRERLKRAFPHAKVFDRKNSKETQDAWNRGEIEMLLVHPKSASHGLNLQFGGNIVVWYGLSWSLEDYIQLNKRLHRSGQTRPVMIHHILVRGTIDEEILESLTAKNAEQEDLLNALKKRIEVHEWAARAVNR